MIDFKRPEPADRSWVEPLLQSEGTMACEYNFNNIYLWSRAYLEEIARLDGRLLVRVKGRLGVSYLFPVGSGPLEPALAAVEADAAALGYPLQLVCLTAEQKAQLDELWPGRFEYECDRDGWDYIYSVDKLADLAGKKLHAKRNHIHRFDDAFPDWLAEPITAANVEECVELERAWVENRDPDAPADSLPEETIAVIEGLYLREELGLEGVLIRAGGRVVAFSLGSFTTPECFDVHFEKAYGDIQGAYPVVNREMARMIRDKYPAVKWFDREDDLGIEGLRKAKLSYYPDLLLEKCSAVAR